MKKSTKMPEKKKRARHIPEGKRNVVLQMYEEDIEMLDNLCKVNQRSRCELMLIWIDRATEDLNTDPNARINPL